MCMHFLKKSTAVMMRTIAIFISILSYLYRAAGNASTSTDVYIIGNDCSNNDGNRHYESLLFLRSQSMMACLQRNARKTL